VSRFREFLREARASETFLLNLWNRLFLADGASSLAEAEEEEEEVSSDRSLERIKTCSTMSSSAVVARLDQHSRAAAMGGDRSG